MEPGDAGVFELVGLLLADPSVQARVQADSMLRNLWSDPAVRQQIQQGPGSTHEAERQQADSAAIARVVHQFHAALEAGDSTTALRLLDDDAVILESGDAETKQEYRSHHLPSDIAFARAVPRQSGPVRVVVRGDVAWASSTGVARGRFRDRDVNSQSAELMILERRGAGWVISAIHWSSRAIR